MEIDWESGESHLIANPSYSDNARSNYRKILEKSINWPGHIWLATSGSTVQKWVGLSKQAVLASAQAVNVHLQSHSGDKWALALPTFHAGGLGILARSYLSRSTIDDFYFDHLGKWDALAFYEYLIAKDTTLTSLVPAQLYDLVLLQKPAPKCLRAVIIGGGVLLPELYFQAIQLGWKILPSYGLTECASSVATASLNMWGTPKAQKLKILNHMEVSVKDGLLALRGPSVMSVYAFCCHESVRFEDPKKDGWFISEDRGIIDDDELTIDGRVDQLIKIGGENVDFASLEALLQSLILQFRVKNEMTLLAFPDERLGQVMHLVASGQIDSGVEQIRDAFDKKVLPFERIRQVHIVDAIPKSALFKILRKDLLKLIVET
jgi:O-succinylbenzoic acid--CoA ligase